jgi:hypothetical protein
VRKDILKNFLKSCLTIIPSRWKLFVSLNLFFFGCIFITLLVATIIPLPATYLSQYTIARNLFQDSNWLFVLASIFSHNLGIALLAITLPGIAFFALSMIHPLYTAISLGLLTIYPATSQQFFLMFPTLVLEGEAIVLAVMAGVIAGASWFNPKWHYPTEDLSRVDAFMRGLGECLRIYIIAVLVFFIAAIVETVTLFSLS